MSTQVAALVGVRIDAPKVADRSLHCIVCRGLINRGENCWESGTVNEEGKIEYYVFLHSECLSLFNASVASRI